MNNNELIKQFWEFVEQDIDDQGDFSSDKKTEFMEILSALVNALDSDGSAQLKIQLIDSALNSENMQKLKKFFNVNSVELTDHKITPAKRDQFIAQLTLLTKQQKPIDASKKEIDQKAVLLRMIKEYNLPQELSESQTLLQANEYKILGGILKRNDIDLNVCFEMIRPYFLIRSQYDPVMPASFLNKFEFYNSDENIKEEIRELEETIIGILLTLADKNTNESAFKLRLERTIPHLAAAYPKFTHEEVRSRDVLFQAKLKQKEEIKRLNQLIVTAQNQSEMASKKFKFTKK